MIAESSTTAAKSNEIKTWPPSSMDIFKSRNGFFHIQAEIEYHFCTLRARVRGQPQEVQFTRDGQVSNDAALQRSLARAERQPAALAFQKPHAKEGVHCRKGEDL